MWLAKRDRDQLLSMCRKARAVWEEYFQPRDAVRVCLEYLRRHLPAARAEGPGTYRYAPSELARSPKPRCLVPENFYANMPADHKKTWLNQGLDVAASELEPGVSLINGVRSEIALHDLLYLLALARNLPENGSAVCSGAPSGVVSIMLATALNKCGNFSSLIYSVEDWPFGPEARPGETFKDFRRNLAGAWVGECIRPVRGGSSGGAEAFREQCLDLVVLAESTDPPARLLGFRAWLPTLKPGGRLVLICRDKDALLENVSQCAAGLGLEASSESRLGVIVLFKPERPGNPVAAPGLDGEELPPRPDGCFAPVRPDDAVGIGAGRPASAAAPNFVTTLHE